MKKMNNKGFTLIELLVVIAIIGVLSTMAIINVRAAQEKARDTKRITAINSLRTAVEMYIADNNHPPIVGSDITSWSGAANSMASELGDFVQGGVPYDPVGSSTRQFCYCSEGQDYLLATVAESSSKTFEGDFDDDVDANFGGTSAYTAAANCMCTDDAIPTGAAVILDCGDTATAGIDNVAGPVFCIGTSG